jgi:hypothetical protein
MYAARDRAPDKMRCGCFVDVNAACTFRARHVPVTGLWCCVGLYPSPCCMVNGAASSLVLYPRHSTERILGRDARGRRLLL